MTLKEHIHKTISLATPIMITQAGAILVNVVDNIVVGQLEGETGKIALGAVSLGNAVFFSGLVLLIGFSFAMSPIIAQAIVQGKNQRVQNVLSTGLTVNLILSVFIFLIFWFSLDGLYYLDQPPEVVPIAISYLKINLISLFPFMIFQSFRQFSEGLSLTMPIMVAVLVSNVINIILNYLLVYGNLGFPRLEVDGSAWATFIARVIMMILLYYLLLKSHISRPFMMAFKKLEINKFITRKLFKLGVPSAFQLFFEVTTFAVAAFICGKAGTNDLAAHQISITLASVTFMLCTGLSVAGTIRVGNQLGLKDYRDMKTAGLTAIGLAAAFMILAGISFIVFRNYLPSWFNHNSTVIALASQLLIIAAIFQLQDGVQVVTIGCLRGLQDVNIPTVITFIAYFLVTLPLGYYLGIIQKMGAMGMWIALGIGLFTSAVLLFYRFIFLTNKLIKNEAV